ncbi:MAG TPA: 30S ribosomal protein S6 [Sandaracinaceae bacterium]
MPEAQRLAREYELVYILRPTVSPSEARKVADRIVDVVEKRGAKLTRVDNWGKRKLAYPIQKHTRGVFVYVKLVGFADVVAELERNLRNFDEVVRYQTVRLKDVADLSAVQVDPEEVQFRDIETTGDEEEEEPSFEERLGMATRARREEADEETEGEGEEEPEADEEEGASDEDAGGGEE